MYICRKKKYGHYDEDRYDEPGLWWGRMFGSGSSYFVFLEEVKKDLEAIDILNDADFDKINDENFYSLISRFYSIALTLKDFLNIISRVNCVYYDKIELLNTKQTFEVDVHHGSINDCVHWTDKYQARWIVATARNFSLNPNYNYSKDEIDSMILNKQIVAISKYPKKVGTDKTKLPYEEEKVENMEGAKIECDSDYITGKLEYYQFENPWFDDNFNKLKLDFNCLKAGKNDFSKKIYKEACSMIKMRLNKKQVLKECEQIILFLTNEVEKLFPLIEESYFCVSSDKKKYLILAREITDMVSTLSLKLKSKIDEQGTPKVLRKSF